MSTTLSDEEALCCMSSVTTMVDATNEDSKASGSESRYVLVKQGTQSALHSAST